MTAHPLDGTAPACRGQRSAPRGDDRHALAGRRIAGPRRRRRAFAASATPAPWHPPTSSRPSPIRAAAALAVLSVALGGCAGHDRTATAPAPDAPLGRPIVASSPTAGAGAPGVRVAARAFVTSYLAVSYGHASPAELRAASRALRDRLRAQAPRVPPGVRSRRPRLVALRFEPVGDELVRAIATIEDGDVAPYPLFATLRRVRGRWVATSVGG